MDVPVVEYNEGLVQPSKYFQRANKASLLLPRDGFSCRKITGPHPMAMTTRGKRPRLISYIASPLIKPRAKKFPCAQCRLITVTGTSLKCKRASRHAATTISCVAASVSEVGERVTDTPRSKDECVFHKSRARLRDPWPTDLRAVLRWRSLRHRNELSRKR